MWPGRENEEHSDAVNAGQAAGVEKRGRRVNQIQTQTARRGTVFAAN
jgi:hypothetical protein